MIGWIRRALRRLWAYREIGARRDEIAERRRQRGLRKSNYQYAIRLVWRLKNIGRARVKRRRLAKEARP